MSELGTADVVIAGAGMAGLCAAVSAAENGAERVVVLEKGPSIGGSAQLSNGNFGTFLTAQRARRYAGGGDPYLQQIVIDDLEARLEWLSSFGVEISWLGSMFGEYKAWKAQPTLLLVQLMKRAESLGVAVHRNLPLAALISDDTGGVGGVYALREGQQVAIPSRTVVLATGGFQGNADLVKRYLGQNVQFAYHRANPWSSGDGLLAALRVGAKSTTGLDTFYGHAMPAEPAHVHPATFATLTQYYGSHSVAVNMRGERFVDESSGVFEENVNWALARQDRATGFYILDDALMDLSIDARLPTARSALSAALSAGAVVVKAESIAELAAGLAEHGVARDELLRTLEKFNKAMSSGAVEVLEVPRRRHRRPLSRPPYFALMVTASVTMTTGGIAVSEQMQVLARPASAGSGAQPGEEAAIPYLFAAGADVGGISHHGYLGGLPTALTTGYLAGRTAASVTDV